MHFSAAANIHQRVFYSSATAATAISAKPAPGGTAQSSDFTWPNPAISELRANLFELGLVRQVLIFKVLSFGFRSLPCRHVSDVCRARRFDQAAAKSHLGRRLRRSKAARCVQLGAKPTHAKFARGGCSRLGAKPTPTKSARGGAGRRQLAKCCILRQAFVEREEKAATSKLPRTKPMDYQPLLVLLCGVTDRGHINSAARHHLSSVISGVSLAAGRKHP